MFLLLPSSNCPKKVSNFALICALVAGTKQNVTEAPAPPPWHSAAALPQWPDASFLNDDSRSLPKDALSTRLRAASQLTGMQRLHLHLQASHPPRSISGRGASSDSARSSGVHAGANLSKLRLILGILPGTGWKVMVTNFSVYISFQIKEETCAASLSPYN